jgi:hypothetical protein
MKVVPTLLENLTRFYDALDERAIEAEDGTRIFKGHTTVVARELDPPITSSHYSHIRRHLLAMDCVGKMQAGARNSESIWVLHQRPTQELLDNADPGMLIQNRNEREKYKILAQQVKDLKTQLGGLNVLKAIKALEDRINELEAEVHTLQGESK